MPATSVSRKIKTNFGNFDTPVIMRSGAPLTGIYATEYSDYITCSSFYTTGNDQSSVDDSYNFFVIARNGNITSIWTLPNDSTWHVITTLPSGYKIIAMYSNPLYYVSVELPDGTRPFASTASPVVPSNTSGGNRYGVFLSLMEMNGKYDLVLWASQQYAQQQSYSVLRQYITEALTFLTNDPYCTIPENENPGTGYGPYDYTSETDLPPSLPNASAAQCGFVSLWNPDITELQGLASYLWTSGLFDINTWRHLFSNPMDCILSVGIIPFVPDRALSKEEIVFCGTSHSGISSYRVPTQMYIIPMGTMHITGMSGGYTDYEPYAKASLFLPYCGTYALSCDEIVDADLSLEYHVDIYTGACVAYLTIERTNSNGEQVNAVMYQFTGNMLSTIPVTGADHSNFIQSLLFMGAAIGATVATSGAAAPEIGGAMAAGDAVAGSTALTAATAGSAINTVMSMKPNVMRSGNLSSNAGLLGKQAPTITMTWSNICRPEDEYKLAGMPLHKSGTLSDFSGFTVVSAVHMDNILCTEEEKTMIEELLYKGVII